MARSRVEITSVEDALAVDFRSFGQVVDAYIKGDASEFPLSPAELEILESPSALMRLWLHLKGIERSLQGQVLALQANHESNMIQSKHEDTAMEEIAAFKKSLAVKYRFGLGLNDALTKVEWLVHRAFPSDFSVRSERDSLIEERGQIREALLTHRQQGLADPDGTLDREEDLWRNCTSLIGPTPEEE